MVNLTNVSENMLRAMYEKRGDEWTDSLDQVIALGYGDVTFRDMEALARDGNAVAIAHMNVWHKLKDVTNEMDARQRWHGSNKPIRKRA
jgi:hypothetical protein